MLSGYEDEIGFTDTQVSNFCYFQAEEMSETSVMNAMDDALPSIGYLNVHGICRRTYGKETKAHTDNPHFPTHNVNWGYPTQERLKRLWL